MQQHKILNLRGDPKEQIGTKASNLNWLMSHGLPVPPAYVVPFSLHADYKQHGRQSLETLRLGLGEIIAEDRAYAVRSSANLEDSNDHSFAGQFTSILDLQGVESILDALEQVYSDADSSRSKVYMQKRSLDADDLRMAVIIQEMVKPHISGVAFSRNPLTGHNEIVIEAVQGSGEALMQGGQTPERWVHKWGKWVESPDEPLIDAEIIQKVAADTQMIEERYGCPVDLEWVFDGYQVQWVQIREITGLGDISIYSNRISREFLPGLILPLVWSVNVPLVNRGWIQLFSELIGPNDLDPHDLAKSFHYHAYFNMGAVGSIFAMLGFPSESLELLMGLEGGEDKPAFRPTLQTVRHMPRMIRFLWRTLRYGRRFETKLPTLTQRLGQIQSKDLSNLNEPELLVHFDAAYAINADIVYENIIVPMLLSVYSALLRRQLSRMDVDYTQFDYKQGLDALEQYDPNAYLARLQALMMSLPSDVRASLPEQRFEDLAHLPGAEVFYAALCQFRDQFGHLSESGNDFSKVTWREDPEFLLRMVLDYEPPRKASPPVGWEQLSVGFLQRLWIEPIYQRSRAFLLFREAISSRYTQGIAYFRAIFLALGERWTARGLIQAPEDIFYLYLDEVREGVEAADHAEPFLELVAERQAEIRAAENVVLPELIYGEQAPPLEKPGEHGTKLHGIPSSRGYYQGSVNVIRSSSAFEKMQSGDVLVIPYSDVAWVPLFAKAGAVIAESGGMLSHSSIVAREYGLPCVVSVPNACSLADGTQVRVDGYKGEVTLVEADA